MNETQDSYLTIKESAVRLNLKESKLRAAIRKNELTFHQFGKLFRIKISDLDAWVMKSRSKHQMKMENSDDSTANGGDL